MFLTGPVSIRTSPLAEGRPDPEHSFNMKFRLVFPILGLILIDYAKSSTENLLPAQFDFDTGHHDDLKPGTLGIPVFPNFPFGVRINLNSPITLPIQTVSEVPDIKFESEQKQQDKKDTEELAQRKESISNPVQTKEPVHEPVQSKERIPEPVQSKERIPEPVQSKERIPETGKSKKRIQEPVQPKEPNPEPITSKEPIPEPVQSKERIPEPVQSKERIPEPVQSKERIPETGKSKKRIQEPVQPKEPNLEPIKSKEPIPEPVQSKEPNLEPIKSKEPIPEPVHSNEQIYSNKPISEPIHPIEAISEPIHPKEPISESPHQKEPISEPPPQKELISEPSPQKEIISEPPHQKEPVSNPRPSTPILANLPNWSGPVPLAFFHDSGTPNSRPINQDFLFDDNQARPISYNSYRGGPPINIISASIEPYEPENDKEIAEDSEVTLIHSEGSEPQLESHPEATTAEVVPTGSTERNQERDPITELTKKPDSIETTTPFNQDRRGTTTKEPCKKDKDDRERPPVPPFTVPNIYYPNYPFSLTGPVDGFEPSPWFPYTAYRDPTPSIDQIRQSGEQRQPLRDPQASRQIGYYVVGPERPSRSMVFANSVPSRIENTRSKIKNLPNRESYIPANSGWYRQTIVDSNGYARPNSPTHQYGRRYQYAPMNIRDDYWSNFWPAIFPNLRKRVNIYVRSNYQHLNI